MADAVDGLFTPEEVERGRRYARPLYVVRLTRALLSASVLAVLAWTPLGDLPARADAIGWPLATLAAVATCLLAVSLVTLPLSLWAGLFRERRFGLSSETLGGWLVDRAKGLAVGAVLVGGSLLALGALVRVAPDWWPVLAAAGAGALVVLLGFLAPVVFEPLFNRFRPVEDADLASRLARLGERAGVPVREVLVADASRRTRKLNAYVSGVGRTRRVVLFDTLLQRAPVAEVEAVVAHELAHRRARHVERFTAMGVAATAAAVAAVALALGDGAGDPRRIPELLLLVAALELAVTPLFAYVSRRFERVADRTALELTGDAGALESMFRTLATANLADLAPPRLLHALLASHPTIPERVQSVRRRAGRAGVA